MLPPDLCPVCGAHWQCDCVRLYLTDAEFHHEVELGRVVNRPSFVIPDGAVPSEEVFESLRRLANVSVDIKGTFNT